MADNLELLNTPRWGPTQTFLALRDRISDDDQNVMIVWRDAQGTWRSACSSCSVGDLLTSAKILEMRALEYLG